MIHYLFLCALIYTNITSFCKAQPIVSTIAGNGAASSLNGQGTQATFDWPGGLKFGPNGDLFIADINNNMIRKITPSGYVSTVAGKGTTGTTNGPASSATFTQPRDLVFDLSGNLLISDLNNDIIRKIDTNGVVSTLTTSSSLDRPFGLEIDKNDVVYVAEFRGNQVWKISTNGVKSLLAGSGSSGYIDGPGTSAQFSGLRGITFDTLGNLLVADASRIRVINTVTGMVSTLAGGASGNADGQGTLGTMNLCVNIVRGSDGNLFVSDSANNWIRRINSSGYVSRFAGSIVGFADGSATEARFSEPRGLAIDAFGSLYVADGQNNRIRKITCMSPTGSFSKASSGCTVVPCPAGTYQPNANQPTCLPCPPQTYQPLDGQTSCQSCPANATCVGNATFQCQNGFVISDDQTACVLRNSAAAQVSSTPFQTATSNIALITSEFVTTSRLTDPSTSAQQSTSSATSPPTTPGNWGTTISTNETPKLAIFSSTTASGNDFVTTVSVSKTGSKMTTLPSSSPKTPYNLWLSIGIKETWLQILLVTALLISLFLFGFLFGFINRRRADTRALRRPDSTYGSGNRRQSIQSDRNRIVSTRTSRSSSISSANSRRTSAVAAHGRRQSNYRASPR